MQKQIQRLLARIDFKPEDQHIGVAVSGGCDSVALLYLLHNWAKMNGRKLYVFHVDHGLRQESSKDRKWVEKLALKLELEFVCRTAQKEDFENFSQKQGKEAWARSFRYSCLAEMARKVRIKIIATGHTCDDQLETVLMRMFGGSSLQGFGGIRHLRKFEAENTQLELWRPLLKIRRVELERFLRDAGQEWLTDQTNFSEEFLRNAVRQNIVPEILKLFPGAGAKVQTLVSDVQEAQKLVQTLAQDYLERNLTEDKKLLKLANLDRIVKREVLRLWLIELDFNREINRATIDRLVDLWEIKSRGRAIDHRKYRFVRETESIRFIN